LTKWWKDNPLFIFGAAGTESTLVIKNAISNSIPSVTINIPPEQDMFNILDQNDSKIGELDINGKYKSMGYSLINYAGGDNVFNGSDFFHLFPVFSNSEQDTINTKVHYKIDGVDIKNIASIEIPANNS
jgi:hypothetical protein